MTRDQLLTLLRAAALPDAAVQIVVVGSQSVLGAHPDDELPDRATQTAEADVMYRRAGEFDQELTEIVDAHFGEGSAFHEEHGVYLQGVDEDTSVLPAGWDTRLVHLDTLPPRDDTDGTPDYAVPVLCLEPHDLSVAKLAAGRPKDIEFVHALLLSGHLDATLLRARATQLDPVQHPGYRSTVERQISGLEKSIGKPHD